MANEISNDDERRFYEILGKRISDRRKDLRKSRKKVAKSIGISEQHLGFYERGKSRITIFNYYKICRTLRISPSLTFIDNINDMDYNSDQED